MMTEASECGDRSWAPICIPKLALKTHQQTTSKLKWIRHIDKWEIPFCSNEFTILLTNTFLSSFKNKCAIENNSKSTIKRLFS